MIFPLGNFATSTEETMTAPKDECRALYDELNVDIDYSAFEHAWHGFTMIDHKKELMTVIDFTKPSTSERLFIIDMTRRKVVLSSHVAHGQGSGDNYATSFGNEDGSHKSSLGFYLTGETYYGQNGYSMRLYGLESILSRKGKSFIAFHL